MNVCSWIRSILLPFAIWVVQHLMSLRFERKANALLRNCIRLRFSKLLSKNCRRSIVFEPPCCIYQVYDSYFFRTYSSTWQVHLRILAFQEFTHRNRCFLRLGRIHKILQRMQLGNNRIYNFIRYLLDHTKMVPLFLLPSHFEFVQPSGF